MCLCFGAGVSQRMDWGGEKLLRFRSGRLGFGWGISRFPFSSFFCYCIGIIYVRSGRFGPGGWVRSGFEERELWAWTEYCSLQGSQEATLSQSLSVRACVVHEKRTPPLKNEKKTCACLTFFHRSTNNHQNNLKITKENLFKLGDCYRLVG
jgi:hypothetical protein